MTSIETSLCRRVIACLDVDNGRTVKGVKFQGLRDVGDPVELALRYQEQGVDELVFLDISASHEGRSTMFNVVSQVAAGLMIPFTVGGGIRTLDDVKALLDCGADKVSINTAAVERPALITEIAQHCGAQCCVLAIDTKGGQVVTHGGRKATGRNTFDWAQEAVALGAGEILLTSWDKDGTQSGFDLPITQKLATGLSVPVIASGGAHTPQSIVEVFAEAQADAALAATMFHDGHYTIAQVKQAMALAGLPVRLD